MTLLRFDRFAAFQQGGNRWPLKFEPERSSSTRPTARLRACGRLPIDDVRLSDPIWEPRRRLTTERTIPEQHAACWRAASVWTTFAGAPASWMDHSIGRYFNDTDVYKWLEAAAWALAMDYDPALDALVDEVIEIVGEAQQPDGYLDNFYIVDQLDKRWTNLTVTHELYCAGHLFQAAVAHFRATGKRSPARHRLQVRRSDLRHLRSGRIRQDARHRRPRRNRAGHGRAGPCHRQPALHRPGALLPRRARIRPGRR